MGCHFLLQICVKARLKAAQQKVISYAWVSAITQEPNENTIACLERLKEALQKFTNLDLDSYEGDFKGQIPSQMCIRNQDKVTTATAAGPLLPLLMRWSRQPPIPFITENRIRSQGPGEGGKERDKACPDAGCPPGKPYGKP